MAQIAKVAGTATSLKDEAKRVEVAGKKIALFNLEGSLRHRRHPHAPWWHALRGRGVGREGPLTSGPSRTDREGRTGCILPRLSPAAPWTSPGGAAPCGLKSAAGVSYGEKERPDESREGH
jgi:hypothetical protein